MKTTEEKADLAKALRTWRGDMTMKQAAELIGIPARTLEGIEQGRGFSYPQMLKIAMKATKGADNA
ncbi:XRE family transcriptional regulator [Rhizobium leguminosarum bv. viciae]|nr:helix-turn-helix transcriptional regulator [Rhizobium leguminosarum]NKK88737.1 XRE family transcriptional regulator [Rhizobium leguminosarum bv. viciae]TAY82142.1 XRE family transcriptional regulator [Rhizobium ruizarguesonis]